MANMEVHDNAAPHSKLGGILINCIGCPFRAGISVDNWMTMANEFEKTFKGFVGSSESLTKNIEYFNLERRVGLSSCKRYL